jgi:hypothetical protein
MTLRARRWLLYPALGLFTADVGLTLAGQPAGYWAGDHDRLLEANPIAYVLLGVHPGLFAGAALAWMAAFSACVLCGPRRLARGIAYALAIGHGIGSSSWIIRHGSFGWMVAVVFLVFAARLAGICWERADAEPSPIEPPA